MSPKVSVIIPCYNQAFIIEETLESVYLQTFSEWECIIVDDGSTDNSKDICDIWCAKDARFKYFYKNNGGLSSARNYGIEKSLGTYLQFLDSDDLIGKDKLKLDVEAFRQNETIGLVYSLPAFFTCDATNNRVYFDKYPDDYLAKKSYLKNEGIDKILENNFTVVSAPLVLKKLVLQIGNFNTKLKSNEDWEFWSRIFFNNTYVYYRNAVSDDSKTLIRVLNNSMSTDFDRMLDSEIEVRKIFENYINTLEDNFSNNKKKLHFINYKNIFRLSLLKADQMGIKDNLYKMYIYSSNLLKTFFLVSIISLKVVRRKYLNGN